MKRRATAATTAVLGRALRSVPVVLLLIAIAVCGIPKGYASAGSADTTTGMQVVFNPTGTSVVDGKLQIRLDVYPGPSSKSYAANHLYLPIVPQDGYSGAVDSEGYPTDVEDYQRWSDALPHEWRLNPMISHFIAVDADIAPAQLRSLILELFPTGDLALLDGLLASPLDNRREIGLKMLPKVGKASKAASVLDVTVANNRLGSVAVSDFVRGNDKAAEDAAIDVGPGAVVRGSTAGFPNTFIELNNPANDTGVIDTVQFYLMTAAGADVKAGLFYLVAGTTYHCRSAVTIGAVAFGSVQTFTFPPIAVVTGDYLGMYNSAAASTIYRDTFGAGVMVFAGADKVTVGNESIYTLVANRTLSMYAAGASVPSVTTLATADIEDVTATGAGNITDTGGANCTDLLMQWGISTGNYTTNVTTTGSFGTGNFTELLVGLPTGETIFARAGANNTAGWGYGAEVTFLTKPTAPTGVTASDGTSTDNVSVNWTASVGASDYHVWRDAVDLGSVGNVTSYTDTSAGAPTIVAGNATASDGVSDTLVVLGVVSESTNNGTTYVYKVQAYNATGASTNSTSDSGWRGVGALGYQWYRSVADSDAAYAVIAGGTTDPYNDVGGVVTPDGRYYMCVLTATGAVSQNTTADRGFMAVVVIPPLPPIAAATGMTLILLVIVCSGLTSTMFATKQAMLGFPAAIFWAITGAHAYTLSVIPWGDIYYFLFFASAFGMTLFTILASFGLRERGKRERRTRRKGKLGMRNTRRQVA